VVLGPFQGAACRLGQATGTRELPTLEAAHLVSRIDALLLTGGSAFGLAAAQGVMAWLEERGRGFDTGVARVPIVPGAVLFDLAEGRGRPDADVGRQACENAVSASVEGGVERLRQVPVVEGRVGAGAGATVGKLAGFEAASPGGLGSWAMPGNGWTVGALAVVNAVGDVVDEEGTIIAGARADDGAFADSTRLLRERTNRQMANLAGRNTTLCVVATDAPLLHADLQRMAVAAATALPRRIRPVNTPFDGDIVFSLGTSPEAAEVDPGTLLALGDAARAALEEAILRAVDPVRRGEGGG
jgi:L-aminopeptidase/D-esterase-like protein